MAKIGEIEIPITIKINKEEAETFLSLCNFYCNAEEQEIHYNEVYSRYEFRNKK